jgi:DNA mismatch repair protein MutL
MGKIRRLSDDLANQIAAGEVVERPASVVKELVENALDAGATRVRVDIELGGTALVRIADDGEGMAEDDARLAVERHATSKIRTMDDLLRIGTFGFRGEALPSIASVSRLTLTTRARGTNEGIEVTLDGGGSPRVKPAGCAEGTIIEVKDLFFNVPARRKFLKSTATESAHTGEVVMLAALSRPDVTFTLARDGKVAREYLRAGTREERVHQVFPDETLHACRGQRGPMSIEAFLSAPERARAGAVALHIFVNGRPVENRQLARAVAQAYGSVLEPGRYPVGAVYLELPAQEVDVNVHPQKAEVRFQDARAVHDAITREMYTALAKTFALPEFGPPSRPWDRQANFANANANANATSTWTGTPTGTSTWTGTPTGASTGDEWANAAAATLPSTLFAGAGFYRRLVFLAQSRATYLVCEGEDGIYVLDQHAAAERVTFDRLRRAFQSRAVAMQRLLVPELVDLSSAEMAALEGAADELGALGIEARAVGATRAAVHGVPQLLGRASPERLLRDVVAEASRTAGRPFGGAVDLVLATMACHGSIRAGDAVSPDEARALLAALDDVDFSGHCPHGRPVVTRLSFGELEQRVGRS